MRLSISSRGRIVWFVAFALCLAGSALADPFTDITVPAEIALNGRNKGVAIADVDGDGFLDMFVSNKGGPATSTTTTATARSATSRKRRAWTRPATRWAPPSAT